MPPNPLFFGRTYSTETNQNIKPNALGEILPEMQSSSDFAQMIVREEGSKPDFAYRAFGGLAREIPSEDDIKQLSAAAVDTIKNQAEADELVIGAGYTDIEARRHDTYKNAYGPGPIEPTKDIKSNKAEILKKAKGMQESLSDFEFGLDDQWIEDQKNNFTKKITDFQRFFKDRKDAIDELVAALAL